MSDLKSARAIADLDAGIILATVEIAASPDRVFKALCSEEVLEWWGSDDTYRVTSWSADVTVGGAWRTAGKGADGNDFEVGGEFLEIDPPHRLVQTWEAGWDGYNRTTLSYRLQAIEGGTRVTVTHTGFAGRPEACRAHGIGWERVFDWLSGHLNPKTNGTAVFVNKLIGPRPSFPFDMTDHERKVMGEHVAYWAPYVENGTVIVLGPVGDPAGAYGLGVVRAADERTMGDLLAKDPAITSGLGFRYDTAKMLQSRTRY
jgi:uncharacterized protein YndB with AHSA1/START domain